MVRGRLKLAAAALLLPLAPALPQSADSAAGMDGRAGLNLSERLCAMSRQRLDTGPDTLNAAYTMPGDVTLRVTVTRAVQPLAEEFADTERAIRDFFGAVVMLRDLPAPPGAAGAGARLWRATLWERPVVTGLWLWDHAGLRIKLRGTVPAGETERLWPEIECAVRTLAAPPPA